MVMIVDLADRLKRLGNRMQFKKKTHRLAQFAGRKASETMQGTPRSRLPALTSLRFFAAFHVLMFHSFVMQGLDWAPAWLQQFASIGYVAVSMFFVLSGFILIYTYSGTDFNIGHFWRARLARLYPVYLLSLALHGPLFFYAVLKTNDPYWGHFKTHLASTAILVLSMLQAWSPLAALGWNGVAWAVSVEFFFYLIFPVLLVRLARSSNSSLAALAISSWTVIVALDVVYVILQPDHVPPSSNTDFLFWLNVVKFHPFMRLPEFIIGVTCGFWFVRGGLSSKLATPLVLTGTATSLILAAFSRYIPYPVMHTGLFAPAFAAIIYGLALRPRWTSFLEWRWLVLFGESSYCFYLLHAMVVGIVLFANPHAISKPTPLRWLGGAITATMVGLLVYRFVEEPARRWLRGKPKATATAS